MFVKNLSELNKNDIQIAGGKGASLGELIHNNIPVPSGFVILSTAFNCFLVENNIDLLIDNFFKNINFKSSSTLSKKIQKLIMDAKMPKECEKEIMQCFNDMNEKYVAVRSSATAEDGMNNAWAGQLDSYLNTTKSNLIENIKKCWASMYNERAINYMKRFHKNKISVSVVIQKMIQSEISGICFTANPLTNDDSEIVIEAGFGLGETIVGGRITPDSYVVSKNDFLIQSKTISKQTKMLVMKDNSTIEKNVENGDNQKLCDNDIVLLSKLCKKIEEHYGYAVDIEWAYEDGKIYIIQARPITTIKKHRQKLTEYVKTKKLIFGIRAKESLLFYSAKQDAITAELKEKGYPEFIFVYDNNDYPIRVYNYNQNKKFESYIEQLLSNDYKVLEKYITDSYKVWYEILNLCDNLKGLIKRNRYKDSVKLFKKIIVLYGIAAVDYTMSYNLGLKLTENKDKFDEKCYNTIQIHDTWRNSIADKEEKMGEAIYLFLEYLIKERNLPLKPIDVMMYLSLNELQLLLQRKAYKDRIVRFITKRKEQGYIYTSINYKRRVRDYKMEIKEIKNYLTSLQEKNQDFDSHVLVGMSTYIANRKIRGNVIIIKDKEELKQKEDKIKNKILVAIQTTPQYIDYLNIAKAIITDEGGITCHAAIISRELRKPCIIGTGNATSKLKDGDYVEMNLVDGSIKIIDIE